MGAMARQGPHHVAQKSTSTGLSDFSTSWSKFASVTSTIPLPAMFVLLVISAGRQFETFQKLASGDRYECFPYGSPTHYSSTFNSMPDASGKSQIGSGRPI